jgi:uncharacterized protein (TIGR00304 family)
MSWQSFFYIGIALVLVGFVVIFVATLLLFFAPVKSRGEIRGGGAVIIGPFPIVFGSDKESVKLVLVLSMVIIALLLFVTALYHIAFS